MKILPLSEVKAKLSEVVDRVAETAEEVTITRNGRPAAVLVNPDEYASWMETMAIQADSDLMAEIRSGLRDLRRRKVKLFTLDELLSEA